MAGQEFRQPPGAEPKFFYGYIVVVAGFLILLVSFGIYTAFGIFFKPLLTDFGWTRAMTSGAFSLSWITSGLLGIVMGGLSDRFGSRIVITFCGFFLGLGYLLMSQIGTIWHFYLFYGVAIGIGMSGLWVPAMSTVAKWFVHRRSMMTGIAMAGGGIGTLVAPLVAHWLISSYNWRTSYIILGSLTLAVIVLAAQFLRRNPTQVRQVPASENEEERGSKSGTESLSLKEAVYTRQFWLLFGMVFCFGFGAYLIIVHIAPHAIELGISSATAANILATVGGLAIVGRIVLGRFGDRIGNRQVFIIGFALWVAAVFWLVQAKETWMLYLFATVFGFAFGCGVANSPLVAELFGLSSHGLILGVIVLSYSTGSAVGPFIAGYIFDVTGSYQSAFLIYGAVSIIGLVSILVLRPIRHEIGKMG